jgi:hypothetical protein
MAFPVMLSNGLISIVYIMYNVCIIIYSKIFQNIPKHFDKITNKNIIKILYLISKRKIIVNTIAWTINPNIVGQPSLLAIGPTRKDNKR